MTKTELIKKATDLGIDATEEMTMKEIEALISEKNGEAFSDITTFAGYGIMWDGENNKALCEFKDGIFETDDTRTIKILTDYGYKIIK